MSKVSLLTTTPTQMWSLRKSLSVAATELGGGETEKRIQSLLLSNPQWAEEWICSHGYSSPGEERTGGCGSPGRGSSKHYLKADLQELVKQDIPGRGAEGTKVYREDSRKVRCLASHCPYSKGTVCLRYKQTGLWLRQPVFTFPLHCQTLWELGKLLSLSNSGCKQLGYGLPEGSTHVIRFYLSMKCKRCRHLAKQG